MAPRSNFHWLAIVSLGGCSLLLGAGCANSRPNASPTASPALALGESVGPPFIRLSENERLGEIVWVDPRAPQAVVRADPDLALPPFGLVISRGEDFTPTAILEFTTLADGASRLAEVLAGAPQLGDEVIAPGPALQAWGLAQLEALDAAE